MDSFKHSFKNTLKENLGLAVYNTGYQKCDGQHTWGPASRDHYLVHYVSAGRGTFTCAGRTHALAEGALFLICPSQVAGYAADREEPWEYCWVGFNGTEAGRLLSLAGFSRETPVPYLPLRRQYAGGGRGYGGVPLPVFGRADPPE